MPNINDKKEINLVKAKHPLLDIKTAIPIDVCIGKNYKSLIITGPNTGGKTVTLKTVGLLTLMACSGLAIPAEENSSIYVFDNIFVDIGDEQSIQESLSTFSGHMSKIIKISKKATKNSLILLDELCSGTDPVEGANLALAILEYFYNVGALTIATTHYQEIKNYALVTNGFENASCEFDVENLKPTYKLLIGIPGKSNAFAISKKLGLDEKILIKAKEFMKDEHISIEELLKNIYDDKLEIENKKEEISKNLNQIELLRKTLEKENNNKLKEQEEAVNKSKEEAKNIILSAKEEANFTLKEINEIYSKMKDFKDLDLNNLTDKEIASIVKNNFKTENIKKANNLSLNLNNSLKNLSNEQIIENTSFNINDLKPGMNVKLNTTSQIAKIESISNKSIRVKVGSANMSIKLENISQIVDSHNLNNNIIAKKANFNTLKSKNISPEINVIGQTVDEACFVIDKYLDDCYIAKLETVRIVHGKGTGALRKGIHNFLKAHPHVKNFRLGTFGEGEMGVTVVTLKRATSF